MEQNDHGLQLTDRTKLSVTGVSGIDSMSDTHVIINLPDVKLVVKGGGLNVNLLNVEEGRLIILGDSINSLEYASGRKEKFSLGKLFK